MINACENCFHNEVRPALEAAGNFIVLMVQRIITAIGALFMHGLGAVIWLSENRDRFHAPSLFFYTSTPSLKTVPRDLKDLIQAYQTLEKTHDLDKLNAEMDDGKCHGQAIALVKYAQEHGVTIEEALKHISPKDVTRYQVLEVLRAAFQRHQRADLLKQLEPFLPANSQGGFNFDQKEIKANLYRELFENPHPYITIRLYTPKHGHTVVLEQSKQFGFYNSNCVGYYGYDSLYELSASFLDHISTHTDYLKEGAKWEIELFN